MGERIRRRIVTYQKTIRGKIPIGIGFPPPCLPLRYAGSEICVHSCTVTYAQGVTTMTASAARASLPALLDLVAAGDEVTITRHGQPVAVVVRPDALRRRRADTALASAATFRDLLAAGARTSITAAALTEARAEELIADISASRDRR